MTMELTDYHIRILRVMSDGELRRVSHISTKIHPNATTVTEKSAANARIARWLGEMEHGKLVKQESAVTQSWRITLKGKKAVPPIVDHLADDEDEETPSNELDASNDESTGTISGEAVTE